MHQIKDRLKKPGKTQVWLIFQLRERGIEIQPPMMSSILRGVYTYPKARQVPQMCEKILKEHEDGNIQCTNQ